MHPPGTDVEATAPAAQVRDIRLAGVVAAGVVAAGSLLDLGVLCPLRRATGVPCPLCGLTSGAAAAARGDVMAAVQAHPLALAAVAILVLAWTPVGHHVVDGLRRHPIAIIVVLSLAWAGRLAGLYGS